MLCGNDCHVWRNTDILTDYECSASVDDAVPVDNSVAPNGGRPPGKLSWAVEPQITAHGDRRARRKVQAHQPIPPPPQNVAGHVAHHMVRQVAEKSDNDSTQVSHHTSPFDRMPSLREKARGDGRSDV